MKCVSGSSKDVAATTTPSSVISLPAKTRTKPGRPPIVAILPVPRRDFSHEWF
uniref:Uncharacterized protein n=1 Tax=Arundo donax TaxID=35708 RepID=A0A0A9C6K5_ARUDO